MLMLILDYNIRASVIFTQSPNALKVKADKGRCAFHLLCRKRNRVCRAALGTDYGVILRIALRKKAVFYLTPELAGRIHSAENRTADLSRNFIVYI